MEPSIAHLRASVPFPQPRCASHGTTIRRLIRVPAPFCTRAITRTRPSKNQASRHFSSQRPCLKSKSKSSLDGDNGDNYTDKDKEDLAGQSDEASAERARYAKSLSNLLRSSSSKDIHLNTSSHTVPSELYEMTFARSSGSGGQNVNKLNTKAVLRFFLGKAQESRIANVYQSESALQKSLLPLPMPKAVANWIAERSPHYTAATHSIVLHSSAERSQAANKKDVLNKLLAHIEEITSEGLRGETSQESLDKLAANKRKFDAQKKKQKIHLKAKTASRRGEY